MVQYKLQMVTLDHIKSIEICDLIDFFFSLANTFDITLMLISFNSTYILNATYFVANQTRFSVLTYMFLKQFIYFYQNSVIDSEWLSGFAEGVTMCSAYDRALESV